MSRRRSSLGRRSLRELAPRLPSRSEALPRNALHARLCLAGAARDVSAAAEDAQAEPAKHCVPRQSLGTRIGFAAALSLLSVAVAAEPSPHAAVPASPLAPAEAVKHFQLDPACRIELAAAEPEVISPVDVRFDEDGRMWVVEMRDYPHGPAKGAPGTCRIKVLEDRDGDGRYETATVFADKLTFATGIQPWRGGAFVTLAGRVAYMKDTNADGRADVDETWFTGFAQENSQLRANHPRLALDNHIYVANGLRGGKVVDARRPGSKPIDISGMDFRFDPLHVAESPRDSKAGLGETGPRAKEARAEPVAEAVSGNGQFGLTFDDYGNRFVCSNRNPLRHVVLEQRYLRQNPLVAVPDVCQDVAKPAEQSRVFPISRAWTTSNLHAGQFTAACGVEIYRGDALGKDAEGRPFYGNAFTCEPTGNLVHREIMKPAGATFTSEPAYKDREFLASTDDWFRPVNLTLGPDGALYVVDMCRAVIEHPEFMPDELKKRPDLLAGNDRGRIWRIVAKEESGDNPPASGRHKPAEERRPQLSKAKSEDLVKLLEHPNAWWRETAQRLLLERNDAQADSQMCELMLDVDEKTARLGRIHAIWTLQSRGNLPRKGLFFLLRDKDLRVAEQALVISESLNGADLEYVRYRHSTEPGYDADARLAYQLALSMSIVPVHKTIPFGRLLSDDWGRLSFAITSKGRAASDLSEMAGDNSIDLYDKEQLLLSMLTLARQVTLAELPAVLSAITLKLPDEMQFSLFTMLGDTVARQKSDLYSEINHLTDETVKERSLRVLRKAADTAASPSARTSLRFAAISTLGYSPDGGKSLSQLALKEDSQILRVLAIVSLSKHKTPDHWSPLLAVFPAQSPPIRRAIVAELLTQLDRTSLLLDELSAGRIKPAELDRAHVDRLLKHSDAKIRERAAKVLADAVPADRQKVLAEYQVVLKMAGDARRGIETFKKNCATCHRIGEIGVNVAPDISDSRVKTPAQLLTDILQPNRAIDANYVSYNLLTTDGRQLTGIIAAETATSVTLRQQEGKTVTLLRSEIEKLASNGVSLMPEGLEKTLPPPEMADVIAFIKNWRYLDGRTPLGNGR